MDSNLTLLALPRLFVDPVFRVKVVRSVKDTYIKNIFWYKQFPEWQKRFGPELTSPIDNKVGTVLAYPQLRAIISQPHNTIDLKHIMDTKKILLVSLSKGQVGEEPSKLFGALLVSAVAQTAFGRAAIDEAKRVPFDLVCDEFQNFAASGFPLILSEARKYRLRLTLAHQGLFQTSEEILDAVFANCGTFISLRVGVKDTPV